MELINKLRESESIVIEGDKKVGKMTLSLFIARQIVTKFTFLTPLSSNKITRKINSLQRSFDDFKELNIDIFSFREDWILVKNEYGYSYLLKDLEYFISHQENEVIVLHKFDTLFEYSDRDFIDDFFMELMAYGIKYKKKLIFTINLDGVNYDLISSYLVDTSDLYLRLFRPQEKREIEVLFSLSPIVDRHYLFDTIDNSLSLRTKEISGYSKREIDVVVITKDIKQQKFYKYILDKEDIHLRIIDSISDSLSIVSQVPDYLVFHQEDKDINFNICELSKKNKFRTLYIVAQSFVRVDDRLEAREKGCVDVISFAMQTMHYILELEKFFSLEFYNTKLIHTKLDLNSKEELIKHINYLIEDRVLFTLIKIEGKISDKNLKFLRDYDIYMEFEEYSVIFLLNVLKKEVSHIIFKKIEDIFVVLKLQDSLDIFYGEMICID